MIGAFLVTCGLDTCMVGLCPAGYLEHRDRLDGRLAQVIEIFAKSRSKTKIDEAIAWEGIVRAVLVDWGSIDDDVINDLLPDSDSIDSDE